MPESIYKIAILGGTFDPIHNGHLAIAEYVAKNLNFSKVLFIPNKIPPHKPPPIANEKHRLNMLQKSLSGFKNFELNTSELDRSGPSYMIDTIKHLRSEYKLNNKDKIWLILGQDAFNKLPTWHKFEELIAQCSFIVINRSSSSSSNAGASFTEKYHTDVQYITIDPIDISATDIRKRLKAGLTSEKNRKILEKHLPIQVLNYIQDNNLYS